MKWEKIITHFTGNKLIDGQIATLAMLKHSNESSDFSLIENLCYAIVAPYLISYLKDKRKCTKNANIVFQIQTYYVNLSKL